MTSTVPLSLNLDQLAKTGHIHPSWVEQLRPVQDSLNALAEFLSNEQSAARGFLPASEHLLRAFQTPFEQVRVVIMGQDPYPTPGHAIGLSFAVSPETKPLPRSLSNILTELTSDLDEPAIDSTVLTKWSEQGVMLLNRVLSVEPGKVGSHRKRGWEAVTECALRALDVRPNKALVVVLWGEDAQTAAAFLPHSQIISSAHPSPLSASRGFFGSRPFTQVNAYLAMQGSAPIEWLAK